MSGIILFVLLIWLILRLRVPDKVRSKVNTALSGGGRVKQTVRHAMEGVAFAKHLALHPFDGFWDLKYLGKGSVASAAVLHVFLVFSLLCSIYYTGFIFNTRDLRSVNVVPRGCDCAGDLCTVVHRQLGSHHFDRWQGYFQGRFHLLYVCLDAADHHAHTDGRHQQFHDG